MSYFSRLTDIVTCNISLMLHEAEDPHAAISEIVREMQEGLAGAQRSVNTAANSESRLLREIEEHRSSSAAWMEKARTHLVSNSEVEARECLLRKREVEDLIAGLEQQHKAAIATREHLATMQRALEARLSEALRKQASLGFESPAPTSPSRSTALPTTVAPRDDRQSQIDAELDALKQQLGQ